MDYRSLMRDPLLPSPNPTESFWQIPPDPTLHGCQSPSLPHQSDVVIIGSGLSACSVTRELLTTITGFQGRICLLEAREVCSGASGRNGGRCHVHAIQEFDTYSRLFGSAAAKKIVEMQMMAWSALLAAVEGLRSEQREAAAFRETESVAAVFTRRKMEAMRLLLEKFEAAFPDKKGMWYIVDGKEAREKYKIPRASGALIGKAGAAWPYRFVTAIFSNLLAAHGDRFSIETSTPVLSVTRDDDSQSYSVKTSRGVVRTQNVVYCIEGHTAHLLPMFRGVLVPRRGQMTVQRPGEAFEQLHGRRSWNLWFDRGYDYAHQNPVSGDVFLGGTGTGGFEAGLDIFGVSDDAEEDLIEKAHLIGIMRTVFGNDGWGEVAQGQQSVKASWTGIMCNSLDHVPIVGMIPQSGKDDSPVRAAEWITAGYGGHGMVNAWLCGIALARQINGLPAPAWLPDQYRLTKARFRRLRSQVDRIGGTEQHLRALL